MNILALDTSTSTLHLALRTDSAEECIMKENFQHSEGLLNEIVTLLERHGLEIKDLGLLVCTRGPGSFTSLRIGMATLKGFSEALGIPLVSVPTLQAIATCHSQKDIITLAVIDAKKKRYYLGLYRNGEAVCSDVDGNIDAILPYLEKEDQIIITGPDALAFEQIVHSHLPHLKTEFERRKRSVAEFAFCNGPLHQKISFAFLGFLAYFSRGSLSIRSQYCSMCFLVN